MPDAVAPIDVAVVEVATAQAETQAQVQQKVELDDAQLAAVDNILRRRYSILTASAGCGKTTVLREMVRRCVAKKLRVILLAPTARAADLMESKAGAEFNIKASTIDMLFNRLMKLLRARSSKAAIFIDEASMMSVRHFGKLLDELHDENDQQPVVRHIVLIGDDCQLPPVKAGSVFKELIATKHIYVHRLLKVYRQNADCTLYKVLGRLREPHDRGFGYDFICRLPKDGSVYTHPIEYVNDRNKKARKEKYAVHFVAKIVKLMQEQRIYTPNVQILCMSQEVRARINLAVNKIFNPTGQDYNDVSVGDPIVNTVNVYDKVNRDKLLLRNGDTGEFRLENGQWVAAYKVRSEDGLSFEEFRDVFDMNKENNGFLSKFTRAYCVTTHYSQGNEYDVVIVVLDDEWMQKPPDSSILYTAMSRAKKSVVLIGTDASLRGISGRRGELNKELMRLLEAKDPYQAAIKRRATELESLGTVSSDSESENEEDDALTEDSDTRSREAFTV